MIDDLETLQRRFERDQAKGSQPVTSTEDLPASYDSITDAWLSEALCPTADARIVGHQFGAPDDGSSERRTLVVDYDDRGVELGLRTHFFCKASMDLPSRVAIGFTGAAEAEIGFYEHIRPHLAIEAPLGFFGKVNPETLASIVIIEDIVDRVQEFGHHTTQITRARAEDQIDLLAKVHGAGYANVAVKSAIAGLRTWPDVFERTLKLGLQEACAKGFRQAEGVLPPEIFSREAEIWPKSLASLDQHRHGETTYTHCDVHLRNWYVTKDGRMGLADWQCASRGHWSRDLAYCLSVGLTIEDRRAWERDLIALYLDRLATYGGPCPLMAEALLAYRKQLMTVLAWWTVTLNPTEEMPDVLQPKESTLCFLERIGAAMADHHTLDAF